MIKIDEVRENQDQQDNISAEDQHIEEQDTAETEDQMDDQDETSGADDAEITDQDNDIDEPIVAESADTDEQSDDQDESSDAESNETADRDNNIDDEQEKTETRQEVDASDFQLENQKGIIEALIFASSDPISLNQLVKLSNLTKNSVEDIISELNDDYLDTRRSFRIENIAGGYRMFTLPEFHSFINQAGIVERTQKLSQAALESLAVIAYKQPITRAEIERIRGVDCGGVLKNLMSKNLILLDGRSSAPGKPLLYRTSDYFLEYFGLPSLDHLPPLSEIEDHDQLPKLTLIKVGEDDNGKAEQDETTQDELDEQAEEISEEEAQPVDSQELQEVAVEEDFNPDN